MRGPWSHTRQLFPGDYAPPAGDRSFYIFIHQEGQRRESVSVDRLSDARLEWVLTVLQAERERRRLAGRGGGG